MDRVWARYLTAVALLLAAPGADRPAPGPPPAAAPGPLADVLLQESRRRDGRSAHSFYFTRAAFSGRERRWSTDYPKADLQFLAILTRLSNLDAYEFEHPLPLYDPSVRRFPFLYAVEVGTMDLAQEEIEGLRDYLLAGGFLMVDDFWGSREWRVFEMQMRRVFPEFPIVEIPQDHEVFHTIYDIDQVVQVPQIGRIAEDGLTYEQDGRVPYVRGIFDRDGRLMVLINWNTDLGDAWEWAEHPEYPLRYSTYATKMAINVIFYAMSH